MSLFYYFRPNLYDLSDLKLIKNEIFINIYTDKCFIFCLDFYFINQIFLDFQNSFKKIFKKNEKLFID